MIPKKANEQIILENISTHKKTGNRNTQHEFIKTKYLSSPIDFYDQITDSVVEGKAVDIVYLDK